MAEILDFSPTFVTFWTRSLETRVASVAIFPSIHAIRARSNGRQLDAVARRARVAISVHRKPFETSMTMTSPTAPTFASRLIPQSREHRDGNGNVYFEHNSWLEIGETVVDAHGDTEMTVTNSRYRNPLTRQELVTVTVRKKDGTEVQTELPASAVRRLKLA